MSKNILMKLLLPILIFASQELFSQGGATPLDPMAKKSPIYIGPVVGYNAVSHGGERAVTQIAGIPTSANVPCPNFEEGSDNGFYVGVAFEYLLGGATNSTSSIIGKILYSTYPSFIEKEGDQLNTNITTGNDGGNQTPEITTINFTNTIDYSVFSAEVLYKLNLFGTPIGAVAGLAFDFTMTATESSEMRLVRPDNATFIVSDDAIANGYEYADANRTLRFGPEGGKDIENATGFRLGLKLGLQYEFSLSGFLIVPHMFYNAGLTSLVTDDAWRVSAFQIGTDIRIAL
jgi:hypothetical protein